MASAPSIAALVSDPVGKPFVNGAPQQNSGSHPSQPAGGSTLTKSTDVNSSEICAPANDVSSVHVSEIKQEQTNTGEKRGLDTPSTTKPGVEESTEPNYKKHKTNEDAVAANIIFAHVQPEKTDPSQAAPQKKKGGRPRKTKGTVKRNIPTDCIGSRTRSRTKIVL
ncbi:hypothetical protein BDW75DRAFT_240012 [Aspergillus navahoensis]